MLKKILFIAYFFPPIGGSGVQRSVKFVHYLPRFGYLPLVVTASGPSVDRWTPDDRSSLAEIPPQVVVNRIEVPYVKESLKSIRIKRLLHINSNFANWWIKESKRLGEKTIEKEDIKVIYASMSPFETAEVAAYLSVKFAIPWIADLRDPWALREVEIYPSFVHRKIELRRMYSKLYTASAIIMNTPQAGAVLKNKFPELASKTTVITNGFDQDDFAGIVGNKTNDKFRIVFTGTFYTDVGLAQIGKKTFHKIFRGIYNGLNLLTRSPFFLLKALREWVRQNPSLRDNLEIIFAGVATEKDVDIVRESGLSDIVRFTGYVPHKETIGLIMTADILFLCMHNVAEGKRATTVGGKDYEYMASGRPILAAVPEGDSKDFLTKCGTALICRPDDHEEMIRILERIYKARSVGEPLVSTNHEFLAKFERLTLTKSLSSVFDKVLENS
jgi:glycosyltransferase involved in cell wall biosynthesis